MFSVVMVAALAATPQVVIELHPEAGVSASGAQISTYDARLAKAVVGDLLGRGIPSAIIESGRAPEATRLAIRLNHHAIPADWVKKGHGEAFYGFALGIGQSNPDTRTTISCTRMIGTALRQAGEIPSLYRSFELPGLDQPLLDPALGIHYFKGDDGLVGRKGAALAVEIGIVSHSGDSERLASPVVVAGLSGAIASGIEECFNPSDEADDADAFVSEDIFDE